MTAYLNDLRIGKARELLADGRQSLLEIALASGFSNQFHFIRTFKKLTSLTPGAYRKSLRAANLICPQVPTRISVALQQTTAGADHGVSEKSPGPASAAQ
ncbi:helix-turn-helix domain-containing protein [Trichloromonas sp.]|uniref:helix-turn-helix domain-containing protein n=1 Tax=Trichloromonas sp. TaxID=3069249 RepID=UPI003D81B510